LNEFQFTAPPQWPDRKKYPRGNVDAIFGIQEPAASWGNLLSQAMDPQNILHYPWVLIPGIFISIAVMSFNFIGDYCRDRLDPSKAG
jgi:ABC-type antimicrobial peptide transport system permease subunit